MIHMYVLGKWPYKFKADKIFLIFRFKLPRNRDIQPRWLLSPMYQLLYVFFCVLWLTLVMIKFYYPKSFLNDIVIPKKFSFADTNRTENCSHGHFWYATTYPSLIHSLLILHLWFLMWIITCFDTSGVSDTCWISWFSSHFLLNQFYSDFQPTIQLNCFCQKSPAFYIVDYSGILSLILYSSLKEFLHWALRTISCYCSCSLPLIPPTCRHGEGLRA